MLYLHNVISAYNILSTAYNDYAELLQSGFYESDNC